MISQHINFRMNILLTVFVIIVAVSIAFSSLYASLNQKSVQSVIKVPSDQPSIQAAIDAAIDGDVILVDEGTYFENINFKGKAITITSQYWEDGDTTHINNTIIDGSQSTNPDSGSTVYFVSGEDTNSVLTGFTITGGKGTVLSYPPYLDKDGGGIFIRNSGAKIEKNKIINNHVTAAADTFAGGAGIFGTSNSANLVIRENEISNNSATVTGSAQAFATVGVSTKATCIFENNHVNDNVLNAPNASAFAAGLIVDGWDHPVGNYIISNNIISNNKFNTDNGGGGGVVIQNCSPIFSNNIISGNAATSWGGGGVWVVHYRFAANVVAPNPLLINNTIINNSSTGPGSGILVSGSQSKALVRNTILWDNSGFQIATEGAGIDVRYSVVKGGYNGVGNVDADPMFVNSSSGDFQLQLGSPCIDAGDPYDPLDPDGTRADIGAKFYYHLDAPYVWKTGEKIDDSNGNNNGRPDAGETAEISITLINTSLDATNVTAKLVSDDPGIQIVQETATFGNMVRNQIANNENNPFKIYVKPGIDAHFTKFYINIAAAGNYTNTDSMKIMVGTPQLLVVDDDNQADYESYFIQPLNARDIYPEHWDISVKGTPARDLMQQYKAVIWFTGDDEEMALSAEEQTIIAEYLDNGGRLFITGQNLGEALVKNGSASDSAFYANYLHAKIVADSTKPTMILGVTNDPITHGLFLNFSGAYGGAGNQKTPDIIDATSGAKIILKYTPGMGGAALCHEDPVTNSRLVYLAFGFEGIAGPYEDSADKLMTNILTWLQGTTDVEQIPDSRLPKEFALEQNYPNPFNPTTTITYAVAKNSHVKLVVYNMLGQVVALLVDGLKSQGSYQVIWNAKNQPSGLYLCRFEADGFRATRKMFLQK